MIIYVILFSLIAGSFAGVLVYRVPIKEKIIFSRSRCDFCEHRIFFYNNIPILSFIFQKGRCRYCNKKLDKTYFFLEIITFPIFLLLYKLYGLNTIFFYKSIILTLLLACSFIDIKTHIIPDRFYISILLISFTYSVIENNPVNWYLGVAAFGLPLFLIYTLSDIFKKEFIGFGDIKLMCSIGGFFSYTKMADIIYFYELLYLSAGLFCFFWVFFKKLDRKVYVAFAPFISAAVILWEFRNVI